METLSIASRLSRGFRKSVLKDQAGRRAMREQAPRAIRDPSFGGADAPAPAQNNTFRLDLSRLGGDWPHQRNLELERRLANALLQSRTAGCAHDAAWQLS